MTNEEKAAYLKGLADQQGAGSEIRFLRERVAELEEECFKWRLKYTIKVTQCDILHCRE